MRIFPRLLNSVRAYGLSLRIEISNWRRGFRIWFPTICRFIFVHVYLHKYSNNFNVSTVSVSFDYSCPSWPIFISCSFKMRLTAQFCLFVTVYFCSILLQSTNAFGLTQTTRWSTRASRSTHLSMADGEKNTENSLMDVLSGTSTSFVGEAENYLYQIISHIIFRWHDKIWMDWVNQSRICNLI